jgi:hypothetical protein
MEANKFRGTDGRLGDSPGASGSQGGDWRGTRDARHGNGAQPAETNVTGTAQGWDAFEIWRSRIHTARRNP